MDSEGKSTEFSSQYVPSMTAAVLAWFGFFGVKKTNQATMWVDDSVSIKSENCLCCILLAAGEDRFNVLSSSTTSKKSPATIQNMFPSRGTEIFGPVFFMVSQMPPSLRTKFLRWNLGVPTSDFIIIMDTKKMKPPTSLWFDNTLYTCRGDYQSL